MSLLTSYYGIVYTGLGVWQELAEETKLCAFQLSMNESGSLLTTDRPLRCVSLIWLGECLY